MRFDQDGRGFKEKAGDFIRQKGFYLVLLGCLVVVGITAFVTFAQLPNGEEEARQARQSGDQTLEQVQNATPTPVVIPTPPASMTDGSRQTPTPTPTLEPTPTPKQSEEQGTAAPKEDKLLFAPVEGEILTAFADSTLLYSRTLKQWTSHKGLDIAAPRGTAVRAVADGVVESVENDIMMGYTITIRHDGNMRSVYANLDALPKLTAGESVRAGTEIGAVGNSAIAESADEPHLHFELYIDEKAVDPLPYVRGLANIPIK
ncbi:MAG: peptidoglycan DD-metalloendopeptidase family protein [Christensenellales bacterium]|jgi:murein DD-endopeptidase MepM/ murein hydrolase activator NlpD